MEKTFTGGPSTVKSVEESFPRKFPAIRYYLRVEHAEQHDTFIDGDTDSGKFKGEGIVLGVIDNL